MEGILLFFRVYGSVTNEIGFLSLCRFATRVVQAPLARCRLIWVTERCGCCVGWCWVGFGLPVAHFLHGCLAPEDLGRGSG